MEHRWDVTVPEATAIQKALRSSVRLKPLLRPPRTIAGADISFSRYSDIFSACVVVLSLPDFAEVERSFVQMQVSFPYVPGYLSFREVPALAEAYAKLRTKPDVVMMDGHGIAHPRRLGVATHLGLVLDVPTFGCAKSLLYGAGEEPGIQKGSVSYLYSKPARGRSASGGKPLSELLGAYVRTKDRVKPVIVSPGHRITLDESVALTLAASRNHRIPEPTRRAHDLVNKFRRGEIGA